MDAKMAKEFAEKFDRLNANNQQCVLAISQALAFAQSALSNDQKLNHHKKQTSQGEKIS